MAELDLDIWVHHKATNASTEVAMAVSVITATEGPTPSVLGEHLRPLTPGGQALATEVFETTGAEQAEPPRHLHPWDEIYVVPDGMLEVFDGESWQQAKAGACACVPADQIRAYRNGSPGCRFLTIAGPGHAREFFEHMDAEVTTVPPGMNRMLAVAARNQLEVMPAG